MAENAASPALSDYDYAGQDPINVFDLDGRSIFKKAWKKAKGAVPKPVKRAVKQHIQQQVYGVYYASYYANKYIKKVPGGKQCGVCRAPGRAGQRVGLALNTPINKWRGKSNWDDARKDQILPNMICKCGPRIYLPGRGYRNGKKHVDFQD